MSNVPKFNQNHATQYSNIGQDLRFYADQRFKVVTVFMLATGFLANIAKDHHSILLGSIGLIFSYLCLSWEKRTTQWWAILFEGTKRLEKLAVSQKNMEEIYSNYPKKLNFPFLKATHAIQGIYCLALISWIVFVIYSWPKLW